ncbi:MAG TPA: AbrB/MazE/SpoVT family DNA-binding domain-containing protein [Sulfurospirillum arcachonense]|nr:AbrB/MazE/SpoVT family DNA-binding domain-containing protein [Sulfurospirillum arcachonense]
MMTAKIFPNGQSQAVRIPKEFRFENQQEVFVAKEGEAIVLFPKKSKFNILFDSLDNFSDDFMKERTQPSQDNREDMF